MRWLVGATLLALASGCCPKEIVDYPVYLDGGIPDGFDDAGCAAACAAKYDASFLACKVETDSVHADPFVACLGYRTCR